MGAAHVSAIPTYLTALADFVDKHGTHAKGIGPELRLLAGLPWERCMKDLDQEGECVADVWWEQQVTPADVARGFLITARPHGIGSRWSSDYRGEAREIPVYEIERAAACAELAVLSCQAALPPVGAGLPSVVFTLPYQGTIEGARAAWAFIASQAKRMGTRGIQKERLAWNAIEDVYRRELEAMK